jgi:hypothetical protein
MNTHDRLSRYINPVEREKRYMRTMRDRVQLDRSTPAAQQERDREAKSQVEDLGSTTLEPRFPSTTVSRKYKVFYHDGVWDPKLGKNGAWSDNMAEDRNDPGPCFKLVNPDAWNFASPG